MTMKRIPRPFHSIRSKLFILLVVLSIVPVALVSVVAYVRYASLVGSQIGTIASTALDKSAERLSGTLKDISRTALTFQQLTVSGYDGSGESTIAEEMRRIGSESAVDSQDGAQQAWTVHQVRERMRFLCENLMNGFDYINGIYVFLPNGINIGFSRAGTDLDIRYRAQNTQWYRDTLKAAGGIYVSEVGRSDFILNAQPSVFFSRALYDVDDRAFLGALMLDCSLDIFDGLDEDTLPLDGVLAVIGESGRTVWSSDMQGIGAFLPIEQNIEMTGDSGLFRSRDGRTLQIYRRLEGDFPWRVVARLPADLLYSQYGGTRMLIVSIAGLCALMLVLLSWPLSKILTEPIARLSRIMRDSSSQSPDPAVIRRGWNDEIGILYEAYNLLIEKIRQHIRDSYQNRLIHMDAQMKALESQINSHFLFNTLEVMHSISEIEEVESLTRMTKALGDMFRYTLRSTQETVTLGEELTHVGNYLIIQHVRHGGRIEVVRDIPDELAECRILKLILQPIVENAIQHGLERRSGSGRLQLSACRTEGRLRIEVADDGVGMSPETLSQIRSQLAAPPGYSDLGETTGYCDPGETSGVRSRHRVGIRNVQSRIRLYYGMEYGIDVESEAGSGTRVRILLPAD